MLTAPLSDCNICHAPKFGKIEERTGAGGGFNERGIVEYKEKVDSDGEYDDVSRAWELGRGYLGLAWCYPTPASSPELLRQYMGG